MRLILLLAALLALVLTGCASDDISDGFGDDAGASGENLGDRADSVGDGVGDAAAPNAGGVGEPGGDTRTASATFRTFFADTVTHASGSKWTVNNASGAKQWLLSNTYYSPNKAWVLGQNYWNSEADTLTSDPFQIPTVTYGIKLAFYTRYNILPGDAGYVQVQTSPVGDWQTIATLTNGSNPAYPGWNKVTYALPDNNGVASNYRVRFLFSSNGSGTSWGWGIDSLSVYQTNLNPPTGLSATEDEPLITVSWTSPSGLAPAGYNIYRSNVFAGTYTFVGTVNAPATQWTDMDAGGPNIIYWYKVKAFRTGYLESVFSEADDGKET